ncbi:MAG: SGNH/GDSL hydrolase family protein [Lachnospiraceae bacterium]|nr:SGNH/GDSL hydrolase family protein [Lachnospiraceae bacterium]
MKTILCYGDSNTYGYIPLSGMRYPKDVRWPGRLQNLLGNDYCVIEEGCSGRTTVYDDPFEGWKNGLDYLKPCIHSHKPVDIVILSLGSNDLKETFHATAEEISKGAEKLVEVIQSFSVEKQGYVPKIVLVSPPEIGEGIASSVFYGAFLENAIERSRQFPAYYKSVAERKGCIFFNAAEYVTPSEEDSLHLTAESHRILSEKLYEIVKGLQEQP